MSTTHEMTMDANTDLRVFTSWGTICQRPLWVNVGWNMLTARTEPGSTVDKRNPAPENLESIPESQWKRRKKVFEHVWTILTREPDFVYRPYDWNILTWPTEGATWTDGSKSYKSNNLQPLFNHFVINVDNLYERPCFSQLTAKEKVAKAGLWFREAYEYNPNWIEETATFGTWVFREMAIQNPLNDLSLLNRCSGIKGNHDLYIFSFQKYQKQPMRKSMSNVSILWKWQVFSPQLQPTNNAWMLTPEFKRFLHSRLPSQFQTNALPLPSIPPSPCRNKIAIVIISYHNLSNLLQGTFLPIHLGARMKSKRIQK